MARFKAALLASLPVVAAGLAAAACSLTDEPFEARSLVMDAGALEAAGGASPGGADTGTEPEANCEGEDCCESDEDCGAAESCAAGRCLPVSCELSENVAACMPMLCSGPDCGDGCSNGTLDPGEADVDCGGSCTAPCADGQSCSEADDCSSGSCVDARCAAASCSDGVRNQDEADVDCGGSCEVRCSPGQSCSQDADCQADGICDSSSDTCAALSCDDGQVSGDETDVDCGGSCSGCSAGGTCGADEDCEDGVCSEGACAEPSCSDGVANQDETGVDCGGSCDPCTEGFPCVGGADCTTGVCGASGCAAGGSCCQARTCTDNVRNGAETGVDCGGAGCPSCPVGQPCNLDGQCLTGRCVDGLCAPLPPCENGVLDPGETDVDCGGPSPQCGRCEPGERCNGDGDCDPTATCGPTTGVCESCADSVHNGDETDVDCGGSCGECRPGQQCSVDADCDSGACEGGSCCGGSGKDCQRCAQRLAPANLACDTMVNPLDIGNCQAFLGCVASAPACATLTSPGCSDGELSACNGNTFGGVAGEGVVRGRQILAAAGCQ